MNYLKIFFITLPTFFLIDMVWLGFVAKNFYRKYLGNMMGDVNWLSAIIFYILFIIALIYFVISPAIVANSWGKLIISAVLFGLVTYATYDLTNLATLKNWPLIVTIVDIIWGMVLSTLVSVVVFFIYTKFLR